MAFRRESRFPRFVSYSRRALLSLAVLLFGLSTGARAIETSLNYELYDAVGNVKRLTTPRGTTNYIYDQIYRLTDEAGPAATQHFNFDANGNRTSDSGGTLTYPPLKNRLEARYGVTQTYDAAGNITNDGASKYVYNAHGQLKQVTTQSGSEIASYKYDYRNRRSRKFAGGQTTVYHYDQGNRLIGESSSSGTLQKSYVYRGNLPVAQIEHSSLARVTYLHTDHLGTPREGRNSQQTVVWRWDSDAFGSTAPSADPDNDGIATIVNLRFPGQYFDGESGLSYNHNRYYVSKTGRYLQSDPIGLRGGINTYAYVASNPLRHSDPHGLYFPPLPSASELKELFCFIFPAACPQVCPAPSGGSPPYYNEPDDGGDSPGTPTPPPIPEDWKGDTAPAPGWEWKGPDDPGGPRGGWVSPDGSESLHGDPGHGPPIGPHTDWNDKNGGRWRIFPDGTIKPK